MGVSVAISTSNVLNGLIYFMLIICSKINYDFTGKDGEKK